MGSALPPVTLDAFGQRGQAILAAPGERDLGAGAGQQRGRYAAPIPDVAPVDRGDPTLELSWPSTPTLLQVPLHAPSP